MTRSPLRAAAAALVILAALAGCSPGRRPVARIGSRTLTVDDFVTQVRGNESAYPAPPEQAKELFLNNLVRRELLVEAAIRGGADTSAELRRYLRAAEERMLLQALVQAVAPPLPAVSEAEARAFFAWRRTEADVQLLYATDRGVARQARLQLDAGQTFDDVADRFNPPGAIPPGGHLGWLAPGTLFPPLDQELLALPIGRVGGPYETPRGFFLLRVAARRPAPPATFEQQRAMLEQVLGQRKQAAVLTAWQAGIEKEYDVRVVPQGGATLFRYLTPGRMTVDSTWKPDARERAEPLATSTAGPYALGDALVDLERSDVQKPSASSLPTIGDWIRARALARVEQAEARRRHLDEEPEFVRRLADERENYLLRVVFDGIVASVPRPDDASVRRDWERVKEQFPQLQQAHVAWLLSQDTALVARIRRAGDEHGLSLREAAHVVDPGVEVHEETVRFPSTDPHWAALQGMVSNLPAGRWSGPDFVGAGWHLLQVLDKVQGPVSWDQLPETTRQNMLGSATQRAQDARLVAITDSLEHALNPVRMLANLRSLPWPLGAPVSVGP